MNLNRVFKFACPFRHQGCSTRFRSQKGRTYHIRTCHTNNNNITPPSSPRSPSPPAAFDPSLAPSPEAPSSSGPSSSHDGSGLDIPFHEEALNIPQPPSPSPSHSTQSNKQYHPWLTGEDILY